MLVTEHLVEGYIVGGNPAYPGEETERLEDIAREEVPEETTSETVDEESLPRDTAMLSDTGILLRMQGVEECTGNEIIWPDYKEIHRMKTREVKCAHSWMVVGQGIGEQYLQ